MDINITFRVNKGDIKVISNSTHTLWARQKKTRAIKEVILAYKKLKGHATTQIAHLVFADT